VRYALCARLFHHRQEDNGPQAGQGHHHHHHHPVLSMSHHNSKSILGFPYEILSIIATSLLPGPQRLSGREGTYRYSDLLAFRSTCRVFRTVANELDFWHSDEVNLSQILPTRYLSYNSTGQLGRHAYFLTLLGDQQLVRQLNRRKTWHFQSLRAVLKVIERVSSFPQTTAVFLSLSHGYQDGIFVEDGTDPVNNALLALNVLHHLEFLEIDAESAVPALNLNIISFIFPSIQSLRLINIFACTGSINRLSNLKSLQLQDVETDDDKLLPVRSATTLSHLSVLGDGEDIICWGALFGETVGNIFTNLTSLCLRFLDDSICEDLAGCNFRLTEFRAVNCLWLCQTLELKLELSLWKL
jgi:hypothetical protein